MARPHLSPVSFISGPVLLDVISPPGYPLVPGWASYSAAVDGPDGYLLSQNTNTGLSISKASLLEALTSKSLHFYIKT